jgi:Uma2 family endonuclease
MNWSEVIAEKNLQDLQYKIGLNEWGNIVMSPASNRHSFLQMAIAMLLAAQKSDGHTFNECSVETSQGVKVADVIWGSSDFFSTHQLDTPYPAAPELCIEIMSPSNSMDEMEEKKDLYIERGALEVWICEESGAITFWDIQGKISTSVLFPDFLESINVPFEE